MRLPLLPSDLSQPFCVVLVHNKATNVPAFAFSNYGIGTLDTDSIKLDGYTIPLILQIENLQYSEVRPSGLGSGLHRREASFTIRNSGPFTTAPFAAGLYSAGVNTDNFYFSVWVMDFKSSLQNIRDVALFLGYFDLDAGIGWDESSLTTEIHLVDRLTNLTGRYATNTEAAEELLQGSEWQRILQEPAYLGYKSQVPAYGRTVATLSGFDTYKDSVLAVVAGIVTSSELSGTSIQLGKSPSLAQFVNVSTKVKFGNGCIVEGVIRDLGTGNYGLDTSGISLNLPWDTIKCFNRGWNGVGNPLTSGDGGADLSSIFLDGGLTEPGATDVARSGTATCNTGSASQINDGAQGSQTVVTSALPVWFKIDLGAGNETMVGKLLLRAGQILDDTSLTNFQLQGSNDDSAWDVVYSSTCNAGDQVDQYFTFTPPALTKYRYYRVYVTSRFGAATKTSLYTLGLYSIEEVPGSTKLDKIPSLSMYVKTNGVVELYSGGVVTTAGPLFCKLAGMKDEANKELGCEPLKDPANPAWKFGGISVEFDAAVSSFNFSDLDLLHLNYAKWLDKGTYGIYFTDKTYVLADLQKSGMPWEILVTKYMNTGMSVEHNYYIKLAGPTSIAESASGQFAVYASNGTSLVLINNSDIDSIAYDCGDFGLPGLCRIKLKRALVSINEAFDPNMLYVDTYPPMHGSEVIAFILDEAGVSTSLRSSTLIAGTATLGNPLGVTITDETWSDLLDSVVFESGLQIDTMYGFYTARASFTKSIPYTFNNVADTTQTFQYVSTDGVILFSDVVDGTYKMNLGRMFTSIDAAGREFVRVHYTYDFVYSNFNGQKRRTLQSTRAAKSNDRKIQYSFKHIVDTATAVAAAQQMQRMGHAANIPESMRVVDVGLPFTYLPFQVLDTIRLVDFRHITRAGDPLPVYSDASSANPVYTLGIYGPYVKYTQDTPYSLIPGIGIVDRIAFNFSGEGVPVQLTFKQMQVNTTSNIKPVAERVEVLNTDEENTEDASEGENSHGSGGYPGQGYRCPPGTSLQNVIILPGEVKSSSITTADPCCNSTTVTGDIISDPTVTVLCVGTCDNPQGCPDDDWPVGCVGDPNVYYEAMTDTVIGNLEPLVFEIYRFDMNDAGCPILVEINYPGKTTPDSCVIYSEKCKQFNEGNAVFALLFVNPCIFSAPEGQTTKAIELVFDVPYCQSERPDWNKGTVTEYIKIKRVSIVITVSLRPVSDISVG